MHREIGRPHCFSARLEAIQSAVSHLEHVKARKTCGGSESLNFGPLCAKATSGGMIIELFSRCRTKILEYTCFNSNPRC
ncbi:hypothetical protein VTL71DRAFT_8544 [Oculimacula yallundae]|uniref:Uncharacterized protein n=1 Tax=Oculimacula yallundae TaxID=86028 RepID=A0ABR4CY04_9HELO